MSYFERLYRYCCDSKKVLWFSLILGTLFVLVHAFFCVDIYNDVANCYLPMARDIGRGQWHQAFAGYQAIAPLLQTLAGGLCYIGCEPYSAVILISGLFYVLTIFPLYLLLNRFGDNKLAAWGSFAYIIAPKIIRFGCTGLLNSGRNLFAIWAIYELLAFFDDYKLKKLLWLGISLAGLALIRGEGIAFIPFFALMFIILFLIKQERWWSWKNILDLTGYGLIVGVTILAIISPRLLQMYHDTGYPVIDARQKGYMKFLVNKPAKTQNTIKPTTLSHAEVSSPLGASQNPSFNQNIKPQQKAQTAVAPPGVRPNTASVKQDDRLSRPLEFLKDFSRGSYEVYLIFALIGIICIIYRRQWNYEYYILLAIILLNSAIFYKISIAYRYFTLNILLFMPFTIVGLNLIRQRMNTLIPNKFYPKVIFIIACGAIGCGQIHNGLAKITDTKKFYFIKPTGDWLKAHAPNGRKLILLANQPQYAVWADAERCPLDIREKSALQYINNYKFDYIVVENKHQWLVNALLELGFKPISHPYKDKVTIFKSKTLHVKAALK